LKKGEEPREWGYSRVQWSIIEAEELVATSEVVQRSTTVEKG
jgi:hypothetical protein